MLDLVESPHDWKNALGTSIYNLFWLGIYWAYLNAQFNLRRWKQISDGEQEITPVSEISCYPISSTKIFKLLSFNSNKTQNNNYFKTAPFIYHVIFF